VRKKNILNMSAKVDKSEMFSGKKDGISFEKLDEMVLSWGRAKFGDKYATLLWKNELTDLNKLDLADELDAFEYDMHCTMVYDVLCYDRLNMLMAFLRPSDSGRCSINCRQDNDSGKECIAILKLLSKGRRQDKSRNRGSEKWQQ
jgi:hypothetical protein